MPTPLKERLLVCESRHPVEAIRVFGSIVRGFECFVDRGIVLDDRSRRGSLSASAALFGGCPYATWPSRRLQITDDVRSPHPTSPSSSQS